VLKEIQNTEFFSCIHNNFTNIYTFIINLATVYTCLTLIVQKRNLTKHATLRSKATKVTNCLAFNRVWYNVNNPATFTPASSHVQIIYIFQFNAINLRPAQIIRVLQSSTLSCDSIITRKYGSDLQNTVFYNAWSYTAVSSGLTSKRETASELYQCPLSQIIDNNQAFRICQPANQTLS
jgi:hypothetical protein